MMDKDKISLINDYLNKQSGMIFRLYHMGGSAIKIVGYWDEDHENKIKIIFDQPYMMLCTFSFAYKGNGDFISLVSGNEAMEINEKYCVIQGNQIYRISNTDVADAMYIAAKCIEVQIMD